MNKVISVKDNNQVLVKHYEMLSRPQMKQSAVFPRKITSGMTTISRNIPTSSVIPSRRPIETDTLTRQEQESKFFSMSSKQNDNNSFESMPSIMSTENLLSRH